MQKQHVLYNKEITVRDGTLEVQERDEGGVTLFVFTESKHPTLTRRETKELVLALKRAVR